MKKYVFFTFLMVITQIISAQDYAEMYRDILEFEFSETFTEEIFNSSLDGDAAVNPELMYYSILYLNNTINKNNNDSKLNEKNLYLQKRTEMKHLVYEWLIRMKDDEITSGYLPFKNDVIEFLEVYAGRYEVKERTLDFSNEGFDYNIMNYVVWKYLSDTEENYSSSNNYKLKRIAAEQKHRAGLKQIIQPEYEDADDLLDDLEKILDKSYLLYEKNHLKEFTGEVKVKKKEVNNPIAHFNIFAGSIVLYDNLERNVVLNIPESENLVPISHFDSKSYSLDGDYSGVSIGAEYSNSLVQIFNYIQSFKVGLYYNYFFVPDNKVKDSFTTRNASHHYNNGSHEVYYRVNGWADYEVKDKSILSYSGEFVLPIYFNTDDIFIEVGARYTFVKLEYSAEINYNADYEYINISESNPTEKKQGN